MNVVMQCLEDDGVEITLELLRPAAAAGPFASCRCHLARQAEAGRQEATRANAGAVVVVNRPRQMPGREFVQNDTERKHIHPSVGRIAL